MMKCTVHLLLAILLVCELSTACIKKYETCGCKNVKSKSGSYPRPRGKRLYCHDVDVVSLFKDVDFPEDIVLVIVDLSDNSIAKVSKEIFGSKPHTLHILQGVLKLDFSENKIERIAPEAFSLLPNLTRLNLSRNSIGRLSPDMFYGLSKLELLDLSYNSFPIINGTVFESLTNLKKLFIQSTNLVCNCLMSDFVAWIHRPETSVKVTGTCHLPLDLRQNSLRNLEPDSLQCSTNNTLTRLPYFEMSPGEPQLVFEGDSLDMQCEGTDLPTSEIFWSFNGSPLDIEKIPALSANYVSYPHKSVIEGKLLISNLSHNHTGMWNCTVSSGHGSETRMTRIMVIKQDSQYCKESTIENNRGDFRWPATIDGIAKKVSCPQYKHAVTKGLMAERSCSEGNWSSGKYSDCSFSNEVTERFSRLLDKDSLTRENFVFNIRDLLDRVRDKPVGDPLTVEVIGQLLESLRMLISEGNREKAAGPLLSLVGYVMETNETILRMAAPACEKILKVVREYAVEMTTVAYTSAKSSHIAIWGSRFNEKVQMTGDGMSCKVSRPLGDLQFTCEIIGKTKVSQPSVSFPKSVLDSCEESKDGDGLYFIAYGTGSLFHAPSSLENSNVTAVLSDNMVFETSIRGCGNVNNLSEPIVYIFETTMSGSYYPAVWTSNGWAKSDSCSSSCVDKNFTRVVCYKVATVTLISDSGLVSCSKSLGTLEELVHPAIFAGTIILSTCLLSVMMSYLFCSAKMRMTTESRHMFVNIWLHLLVASCLFAFCIRRVDDKMLCITCGVILHYTSLSVLLWITLSIRNIHRELMTHTRPLSLEPKPPRPLLRFYLIGCGIPIVICGITVAAKWQNYAGDNGEYCWLAWETSVFAFYIPAAVIAAVCIILLIRVMCAFSHVSSDCDSPRSPLARSAWQGNSRLRITNDQYHSIATEETSFHTPHSSLHPHGASSRPSRLNGQSYKMQLCGVALLFVFYLLTWVSAALSIGAPSIHDGSQKSSDMLMNYGHLYKENDGSSADSLADVFTYVYAVMTAIMGIFVALQHMACRKDARTLWGLMCLCHGKTIEVYRRNQESNSQDSSTRVAESVVLDENGAEYLSPNDKNKKGRGAYTTIKTDPTLETILLSTENGENVAKSGGQLLTGSLQKSCGCGSHLADLDPCIMQQSGRPAQSITSLHSSCAIRQSDHTRNASFPGHSQMVGSSAHRHIPHPYSHDHCFGLNSRGFVPGSHAQQHHGYHSHHLSHQQHGKPTKNTNLHAAHDGLSMTEHSFDEHAHNNMHTMPVIMQHRSQAKINNSAVSDRYQKVRRALERKRARQKKLNVLREYAQDPLTSTGEGQDERDLKSGNMNESSPLIQSPAKKSQNGGAVASNLQSNGAPKYRTLLLSPPTSKKQDGNKLKSGGPTKRLKRLDAGGQLRPVRGEKRAKQSMRHSHNSTLSERERDTTSSEKSRLNFKPAIPSLQIANPTTTEAKPTTANTFSVQTASNAGNENRGYLTLQQLQSANPFLFQNSSVHDTGNNTATGFSKNFTPQGNVQESDHVVSNTSLNSSQMLPYRNETSV